MMVYFQIRLNTASVLSLVITLQYDEFADDALHPTHGKSKFQVGHLNLLKALDIDGANGHTAGNISWISENGNRIQGSLSIDEVDALLRRTYHNRPELHE